MSVTLTASGDHGGDQNVFIDLVTRHHQRGINERELDYKTTFSPPPHLSSAQRDDRTDSLEQVMMISGTVSVTAPVGSFSVSRSIKR